MNKREDALRYNKAQLRRARINLIKADKRGDKRAVKNITRKISIYLYVIDVLEGLDETG
nr:MAG TPA: hypothetical protein [Caudoviricetes sp.]